MIIDSNKFRDELKKTMPGYKWTVHLPVKDVSGTLLAISATGIQTSGFNRLSTLYVYKRVRKGEIEYEASASGFGKRSQCLLRSTDSTLKRTLRSLQNSFANTASEYANVANSLQKGRGIKI